MGVGGQHHAPATLPPGKTLYRLYTRLGGPQGRSGRVRKISPPTRFRSQDRSSPEWVAIPTELSRPQLRFNRTDIWIGAETSCVNLCLLIIAFRFCPRSYLQRLHTQPQRIILLSNYPVKNYTIYLYKLRQKRGKADVLKTTIFIILWLPAYSGFYGKPSLVKWKYVKKF